MDEWRLDNRCTVLYKLHKEENLCTLHSSSAGENDIGRVKITPRISLCAGRKMRFQAEVSTENVSKAGLWLMANTQKWHLSDGMWERSIHGTRTWQLEKCTIQLPLDVEYLSYGLWLIGSGSASIRNFEFREVDESTPVTADTFWDRIGPAEWKKRTNELVLPTK